MTMQMQRAFNSRMLTKMVRYSIPEGSYDANNNWVEAKPTKSFVFGVIKAGNKFSQFEEGIAMINEDGGIRNSDYRSLYITDKYPIVIGDKVGFKGKYYNILQESDEDVFGFNSFIIEKSENWTP